MKALCWTGVNKTSVETVEDPAILNDRDAIVKVTLSSTCGSDLHLLGGYIPGMRAGDVLGHEFMGEIVEVGAAIRKHRAAYLIAVGGAAYLVSKAIRAARVIAFAELGMEAIYELTVKDMPVTVAVDANGESVHESGPKRWRATVGGIPIVA